MLRDESRAEDGFPPFARMTVLDERYVYPRHSRERGNPSFSLEVHALSTVFARLARKT